jgi:hypothetical protein
MPGDADPEMSLLKAIRKADIRCDWPGVGGCRIEKAAWLKAGQVECNDDVSRSQRCVPCSLEVLVPLVFIFRWMNCG